MNMGHMKNKRDKALNKTKEKKNKEKIKISWCSESGIWPHTGGGVGRVSDKKRRQV